MKLAQIFTARGAWQQLNMLKMPPHTAYKLLKYSKRLDSELELIEAQRMPLVKEFIERKQARLTPEEKEKQEKAGQYDRLMPGDPEYLKFAEEFGAVMETESDLKPFNMTLNSILDLASKEQANLLSARDLGQLEPFFEVPKEDAS